MPLPAAPGRSRIADRGGPRWSRGYSPNLLPSGRSLATRRAISPPRCGHRSGRDGLARSSTPVSLFCALLEFDGKALEAGGGLGGTGRVEQVALDDVDPGIAARPDARDGVIE